MSHILQWKPPKNILEIAKNRLKEEMGKRETHGPECYLKHDVCLIRMLALRIEELEGQK